MKLKGLPYVNIGRISAFLFIWICLILLYCFYDKQDTKLFSIVLTALFAWVIVFVSMWTTIENNNYQIRQRHFDDFLDKSTSLMSLMGYINLYLDGLKDKEDVTNEVFNENIMTATNLYFYELFEVIVSIRLYFKENNRKEIRKWLNLLKELINIRREIEKERFRNGWYYWIEEDYKKKVDKLISWQLQNKYKVWKDEDKKDVKKWKYNHRTRFSWYEYFEIYYKYI